MSSPLPQPLTTLFTILHSGGGVRCVCVYVGVCVCVGGWPQCGFSMLPESLRKKLDIICFPPAQDLISLLPSSVSPAACPVLCSGNGQYDKGSCVCYSGWKGPECDVPITQCIDPLCSGHGTCTDGNCVCSIGYKGPSCAEGERRQS